MKHALLVWVLLPVNGALAQIQLDRVFPPSAEIGADTAVQAEGKFPSWPVQIHCDRQADVHVTPGSESGALKVSVDADAEPGLAWIRIFDDGSASKLVPLLIESSAAGVESEPNDRVDQANRVEMPCLMAGRLAKAGDVDMYRVSVSSGQILVVSSTANQFLGSPMDAVMQLVDLRGNVLVQSDDVCGLDPQIVYRSNGDAELVVRIFAFPETPNSTIGFAGAASYVYSLRLTVDAYADHVLPLLLPENSKSESGDDETLNVAGWNLPEKREIQRRKGVSLPIVSSLLGGLGWQWHDVAPTGSTSLLETEDAGEASVSESIPFVFSGRLRQPGEIDRVRFPMSQGQSIRAEVHSRQFGFSVDSVLRLIDPETGDELARNDDAERNRYDAMLNYKAKADGQIELQISDLVDAHGPRAAYSVVVQEILPAASMSVAQDHITVTSDKPTEVTVTVTREGGFDSAIRVSAAGLPDGVHADPVVSEPKGDTAKSVKLVFQSDTDVRFQGNIRIVGQRLDADGNPVSDPIVAIAPLGKVFSSADIWLSVASKAK